MLPVASGSAPRQLCSLSRLGRSNLTCVRLRCAGEPVQHRRQSTVVSNTAALNAIVAMVL